MFYGIFYMPGEGVKLMRRDRAQIEKGLVRGVDLHFVVIVTVAVLVIHQGSQGFHDAAAHVAVEMIVGRKYGDAVFFDDRSGLEIRDCHADPKFPGLVATGDDAAIIIAEHDDGFIPEIGAKDPFAGAIKTITIDDRFHIVDR